MLVYYLYISKERRKIVNINQKSKEPTIIRLNYREKKLKKKDKNKQKGIKNGERDSYLLFEKR